jgi:hypothetical protein
VVACLPSKHKALNPKPNTAKKKKKRYNVCTPVIPALQRQEDFKFKASLEYIARIYVKMNNNKKYSLWSQTKKRS